MSELIIENFVPKSSVITKEQIRPNDTYICDLIRKIPGIIVILRRGEKEEAEYVITRSLESIKPLFFLNNGPMADINLIDSQTVERIVVLKSLAETNIYGS